MNNMFNKRLMSTYPNLTTSEVKIADYILTNLKKVKTFTSQNIANALGIGQATVIRFSKKLGYKSFGLMLIDIENYDENSKDLTEIQVDDTIWQTNDKINMHIKELLDATLEINEEKCFKETIDLIMKAKTIYCFGFLSTYSVADHMNQLLQLFGFNSFCLDASNTMSSIRKKTSEDLLIVFSKSGETDITITVAKYAKEKGVKVVGITNAHKNRLTPYLDVWIKTVFSNIHSRFMHYTENMSLFFAVECIILNLYKLNINDFAANVVEHRKIKNITKLGKVNIN